ncbi:hypothetical protein JVT61DRAFT_2866 [Boletus reticuloceps]|uniref:Uncharacterized protein n=1 Tax=Boletus reticuloceps TaxID=495285 RepID=A0A8I2YS42_9AGAM|nr:hypothetical protein JVT61DRAFT_2866 [Boletus reticuloceps]
MKPQQPYNLSNPSKPLPWQLGGVSHSSYPWETNPKDPKTRYLTHTLKKLPNSHKTNKMICSSPNLKCLEDYFLILLGEPITLNQLSLALFHITQLPKIMKTLIGPIRAVAYLLEEASAGEITESISNHIITTLAPQLGETHMATENLTKY